MDVSSLFLFDGFVIPGCAEGADPESRRYLLEIPGSSLCDAPE
jgi:hypothetical protein